MEYFGTDGHKHTHTHTHTHTNQTWLKNIAINQIIDKSEINNKKKIILKLFSL